MDIVVTRKHIRMGRPRFNKCPMLLAVQEATELDEKCIDISPKVLTLKNYHGHLVWTCKWPWKAERFIRYYFNHKLLGTKVPYAFKFSIGEIEYYPGYKYDAMAFVVYDIKNWHGDDEYRDFEI